MVKSEDAMEETTTSNATKVKKNKSNKDAMKETTTSSATKVKKKKSNEDPMKATATSSATKTKRKYKKKSETKFRKAPQAPKRFKSPFILFSMHMHPELRARIAKEKNDNVPNVAKLVSVEWKNLSDEDRAVWIKLAVDDKKRFELERAIYTGPWKIPASKRARKDPDAPKRPMSAFLAYSKTMRNTVKSENPEVSKNTELSKILSVRWKDEPEYRRKAFIDTETDERKKYRVVMAEWKAKNDKMLDDQRKERESEWKKKGDKMLADQRKERESEWRTKGFKMLADQRKEREDMATLAVEIGIGAVPPEFQPNVNVEVGKAPIQSNVQLDKAPIQSIVQVDKAPIQNMVHPPVIHPGASVSHSHGAPMYASYNESCNTYRNPEFSHGSNENVPAELGTKMPTANQRLNDSSSPHAPSRNALHLHVDQSKPMFHPEHSRAAHQHNSYYEQGMSYRQPHEGRQHPSSYPPRGAPAGPWTNRNQWYTAERPQYHAGYISPESAHSHQRGGYYVERPFENQEGRPNNYSYRAEYHAGGPGPGPYSYPQGHYTFQHR